MCLRAKLTYIEYSRKVIARIGIVWDEEVEVVQISERLNTLLNVSQLGSHIKLIQQPIDSFLIVLRF